MFTANLVDTGLFRAIGTPSAPAYTALERVVVDAETTLQIPATMYAELGGTIQSDTAPSGSKYVDAAIRDGWVTVADPLSGNSDASYDTATTPVERARHDAHHVIAHTTNHPSTVNVWDDTALVGLAVRLFEHNEQIRVIVHTTDRPLATATQVVVPEYGYYDVRPRYYPPQTVKDYFPRTANFTW